MIVGETKLIQIIEHEIGDLECQCYDNTEEVDDMKRLLSAVKNKQNLSYTDYVWIADIVSGYVHTLMSM